jgi:hypothetical protein
MVHVSMVDERRIVVQWRRGGVMWMGAMVVRRTAALFVPGVALSPLYISTVSQKS